MAGNRDESDRIYGPPRITLIPHQDPASWLPALHATRNITHALRFHVIGTSEAWYPATATVPPDPVSWEEERRYRRWIHGTYPEAIVGVSELLSDMMMEDNNTKPFSVRPLLAIGQMTDLTNAKRPLPKPVLAVATGQSGENLRLVALDYAKWHCDGDESPTIRLLHPMQDDMEDVVTWAQDDSPIFQVKTGPDLARPEPSRYVILQKQLSTTVLCPQYRKVPVPGASSGDIGSLDRPSRIDPKPVLYLSYQNTGGSPHSDVAFRPRSGASPEMLAIVDERGYWSVWGMQGKITKVGRPGLTSEPRFCGQIHAGVLENLPNEPDSSVPPEYHGVLWVGSSGPDWNHPDAPLFYPQGPHDEETEGDGFVWSLEAPMLLVWNRFSLQWIDLRNPNHHQEHGPQVLKTRQDVIQDVQSNPANQKQVFVLTSSDLFWMELVPMQDAGSNLRKPTIILSCAHLRGTGTSDGHIRIRAHHARPSLGFDASVVCLHSDSSPDVDIFTFSTSRETGYPQFQYHTLTVPQPGRDAATSIIPALQTLSLAPALIDPNDLQWASPGEKHSDRLDHLWQLLYLHEDLSLRCCMVVASTSDAKGVAIPNVTRKVPDDRLIKRLRGKRRMDFLQHHAKTFVMSDAFGDVDDVLWTAGLSTHGSALRGGDANGLRRWPRGHVEGVELLMSRVSVSIDSLALESEHNRASGNVPGLESVKDMLQGYLSVNEGRWPLRTLQNYGVMFEAPPVTETGEADWDGQLRSLQSVSDRRVVTQAILPRLLDVELGDHTSIGELRCQLEHSWPVPGSSPRSCLSRQLVLAEASETILRSSYGVAVLGLGESYGIKGLPSWIPTPRKALKPQTQMDSSQQSGYLTPSASKSVSPAPSSQVLASSAPSAPNSSSEDDQGRDPLERLSMFAHRINTTKQFPGRPSPVLSYWPLEDHGVMTEGYRSSVQTASAVRIKEARGRTQRLESRRLQRRARRVENIPHGSAVGIASSQQAPTSSPGAAPVVAPPSSSELILPILPQPAAPRQMHTQRQPFVSSSQIRPSSLFSQFPGQIISQPVPGQHGWRPQQQKKRPKRRGGF